MLDPSSLDQLSQLKQNLRAEKNIHEGTVRGTQGRFGFVVLDDGREGFLPPDAMNRVFPGDRVEVAVSENEDPEKNNKISVELEALLSSDAKALVGRYVVQGKGHFIDIDMPQLQRWLFIPPKARGKARAGDYIRCQLTQHPFESGKGQVKVKEIIGHKDTAGVEHTFVCLKHRLKQEFTDAACRQAAQIQSSLETISAANALDTGSLFVTIDAETTRDMDDALSIQTTDSGWILRVAIADPSSAIETDSPLDRAACLRASTAYLPGKAVTMLPAELSYQAFSLVPGAARPALVCSLTINSDGAIIDTAFEFTQIRSSHKLSYQGVAQLLEGDSEACPPETHESLRELQSCCEALNQYRSEHLLLMEERDDYDIIIGEDMRIADIQRQHHNQAHRIVEEAMLACNRSAGQFFEARQAPAIYSLHDGFREEKLPFIESLVKEDLPDISLSDLHSLEGYRSLIKALQAREDSANLLAVFRTLLQAGRLSKEAGPHLGLAMERYATITSPIRRYNDLHNHRVIRALLNNVDCPATPDMENLNQALSQTRMASRDLEQWLYCLWMEKHIGSTFSATVYRVTSQGIVVKLDDWGISGFVKMNPKECQFDEKRMTLQCGELRYTMNMSVTVKAESIDYNKRRVLFTWS